MPHIQESAFIRDVQIVTLQPFVEERGRFMELFRKEWFPQRSWEIIQSNRSDSRAGVLRGLHYHFGQVDYWYVVNGRMRVGLADIRPDSPTCGATQTIEMGEENQLGLFIPIGVAHGFIALTQVTLTYIVDNTYDGVDEYGVAWNDPDLALPWDVDIPTVSLRDAANRFLRDIPAAELPRRG
ncbi:MAG: dTDP-4-dehydrorhamnose 3,5-epimerase [Chloroflexi bacterium ADurb.Bin360]|nr:MAG: dTDP-4-dehydrorhamnose 3,5-epimerase [Chloroflexi bacterium ADurb.Bin360]